MKNQLVLTSVPDTGAAGPDTADPSTATSAGAAPAPTRPRRSRLAPPARVTQAETTRRGAAAARQALRDASQRAAARDTARRAAREAALVAAATHPRLLPVGGPPRNGGHGHRKAA